MKKLITTNNSINWLARPANSLNFLTIDFFDSNMKFSVSKLESRYCYLILYLFILELLILTINFVHVKVLSCVHYILVFYIKMLLPKTENNPIHKIYFKGKFLIILIKNFDSFLRSPNALRMLTIILVLPINTSKWSTLHIWLYNTLRI